MGTERKVLQDRGPTSLKTQIERTAVLAFAMISVLSPYWTQ